MVEKHYTLNNPIVSEINYICIGGKPIKRLMVVLKTSGCSYALKKGGCKHCGFLNNADKEIKSSNLKNQFDKILIKYSKKHFDHVDLLTLGSFLDDKEISQDFFVYSLKRLSNIESIKSIMLESRPEFITEEKIKEAVSLLKGKTLEIGIGIESANETIRTVLLNKGYSLGDVEKKIKILEKYNVGLLSYVLVKPPGVKEHEAIKDAIHTAKYSFTLGAKHNVRTRVALQPFFVPKGSIAEIEYKKGNYKLLKLWSIIEIIKKINYLGSISVALNDESLSDGLVASNCKLCNSGIIAALRKYNCTNNLKFLSDLDCSCKTL